MLRLVAWRPIVASRGWEHRAAAGQLDELLPRQEEHVVALGDRAATDELRAHRQRDAATTAVEQRLLESRALAISNGGVDARQQRGEQQPAHAPACDATARVSSLSRFGLCAHRVARRLASDRAYARSTSIERRRVLLEARRREHQLFGTPKAPVVEIIAGTPRGTRRIADRSRLQSSTACESPSIE